MRKSKLDIIKLKQFFVKLSHIFIRHMKSVVDLFFEVKGKMNKQMKYASIALIITLIFSIVSIIKFATYNDLPEKSMLMLSNIADRKVSVEIGRGDVVAGTNNSVGSEVTNSAKKSKSIPKFISMVEFFNMTREVSDLKCYYDVYTLKINGKPIGDFQSEAEIDDLIAGIVNDKIANIQNLISHSIKEDISKEYRKVNFIEFNGYSSHSEILYIISLGTDEKRDYIVQKGDYVEKIAVKNKMTIQELYDANPGLKEKKFIQIGDVLNLVVPVPLLTVCTVEKESYQASIPFETKEEPDSSMFKGEKKVKVAGVEGKKNVVANVVRQNGIEVSRDILQEEIVSTPTTKVLYAGTKDAPPKMGTGTFRKPLSRSYVVTAPFNEARGGRYHTGIDMAIPTGTAVYAADGGKVVLAERYGNYGLCIIIDHGNNMKTLYAHCSRLLVSQGDKVYKGQDIARSGNTGRSTGPHLHFEIRINNTPVNPRKYLGL